MSPIDLKANPNRPNFLQFERGLLSYQLALVTWTLFRFVLEECIHVFVL